MVYLLNNFRQLEAHALNFVVTDCGGFALYHCTLEKKFSLLKEKPPKGFLWSRERLTKIQSSTRPDHEWPDVWTKICKAAQNRDEQEWAKEKPKLDNARMLRGIYFIDPEDKEYSKFYKRQEETGNTYGTSHAL